MGILKALLSEDSPVSTMRLMSLLSFMVGSGLAFYGVWNGGDPSKVTSLVGIFIGAAFTGKAVQKIVEVKSNGS